MANVLSLATSSTLQIASDQSVMVAAVAWIQATLLGTVATTVAIVAVASVGIGMLAGRVEIRRALTVVLGCFVVFGASSIVAGIMTAAGASSDAMTAPTVMSEPPPSLVVAPPERIDDPYAGASVRR